MVDAGMLLDENSLHHPFALNARYSDASDTLITISRQANYPPYFWRYCELQEQTRDLLKNRTGNFSGMGGYGLEFEMADGREGLKNSLSITPIAWAGFRYKDKFYSDMALSESRKDTSIPFDNGNSNKGRLVDELRIDRLTLGYQNDWTKLELGRGREVVGVMAEDNLLLSNSRVSFDRLLLQLSYKHLSYRFFYGFLESFSDTVFIGSTLDTTEINRYIVGRTLEYNNHSGLIIGVSELSILSGPNRPIDLAFLNPIASHVEIEQNDHDNTRTGSGENGLWAVHLDWRPVRNLRLAGSIIMDDYQLDAGDRDQKQDQLGFQLHSAWTTQSPSGLMILFGDFVQVGTFTTMHRNGINNMVSKGSYLGHPVGNDAEFLQVGLTYLPGWEAMYELSGGTIRRGENSMLDDPYHGRGAPQKISFPSGDVSSWQFFNLKINHSLSKQFDIDFQYMFVISSTGPIECNSRGELKLRYQVRWGLS